MTRRYFGTDGIRGLVGTAPMTVDFALRLASAAARVLAPQGEAYIQVPVLQGAAGRLRRALRTPLLRLARRPEHGAAFRGFRLTRRELDRALADAGLRVLAQDEGPSAYSRSRDRFLRLARAQ